MVSKPIHISPNPYMKLLETLMKSGTQKLKFETSNIIMRMYMEFPEG